MLDILQQNCIRIGINEMRLRPIKFPRLMELILEPVSVEVGGDADSVVGLLLLLEPEPESVEEEGDGDSVLLLLT